MRSRRRLTRRSTPIADGALRTEAAEAAEATATWSRPLLAGSVKSEGRWRHGDLRASLIAWGTHLLDTRGVAGMSVRAAARLAGVSQGAPAHYFKSRNDLLAAIAAQGFRDMECMHRKRLQDVEAQDLSGRLRVVMLTYGEFARTHPARFHLMFGPQVDWRDRSVDLVEASAVSFDLLRSVVEPLIQFSPDARWHEKDLIFAIWVATHGLATLTLQGRKLPVHRTRHPTFAQLDDIVIRFCLTALQVSAEPRVRDDPNPRL